MEQPIYWDHAAAAPVTPEVLAMWPELARTVYANPESIHKEAYRVRRELELAAARISRSLLGVECPVSWAPSGTDLFNQIAALPELRGREAVVSPWEHPALTTNFRRTMKIVPEPTPATACSARIHVQSEIGQVEDIAAWAAETRHIAPEALLVCDTIQSAGKLALPPGADIYTVSGHKIGAPGGAALLLATPRARKFVEALHHYRSRDYRTGRPEPLTVLALAAAVEAAVARREENLQRVAEVNHYLRQQLDGLPLASGKKLRCTLPEARTSPYILHLTASGCQGAVLVRMLSEYGIHLSSGSACQAESDRPSAVLRALGYSRDDAYAGIRLSFGFTTAMAEAERFVPVFQKVLKEY